jgi:kynureninase
MTHCGEQDKSDKLINFRDRFYIPLASDGTQVIYFAGNSLGLQPKSVRDYINQELDDWKNLGVLGHHNAKNPWLPYHEFLTENLAILSGAGEDEVVAMNSLTVNLHLLLVSFYRPKGKKYKILIEDKSFPSDHYALQSQILYHGFNPSDALIEIKPRRNGYSINNEDIISFIEEHGDETALILFSGVNYFTGQAFEMDKITEAGHNKGCIVGFDLAHAIGNIELKLHEWNVDFAVWCSYKYLNGGPGAVGGAFVHKRHLQDSTIPKFWGWWGQNKSKRFDMDHVFQPIPTVESWQLSNPPIFQLAALRASLDIFREAGISELRKKSISLTGYCEKLINEFNDGRIDIITPSDPMQRGCQLSLKVKKDGRNLYQRLIRSNVICDWREPDVIRIAPVPLYNNFSEVERFVKILFSPDNA